jgi:hypothetical protein
VAGFELVFVLFADPEFVLFEGFLSVLLLELSGLELVPLLSLLEEFVFVLVAEFSLTFETDDSVEDALTLSSEILLFLILPFISISGTVRTG